MAVISIFAGALAGLVLLFALKLLEVRRGRSLIPAREKLDSAVTRCEKIISARAPRVQSDAFMHAIHFLAHEVVVFLQRIFRSLERGAGRVARSIRGRHERIVRDSEPSSTFLKDVAEYKKNLDLPPHVPAGEEEQDKTI
ncbi:hypothetical protein COU17_01020 [Candidatus Kaiserbacteria bacterium CG10_big_fil_rev_8_21_14_0_10_49_17]|uniref:Uncharacterized protein n=1 Tax=Candidatus Kaiserbacteria bacterium CG10_big_fil_rev_8_21_14_0_10_49_17 TaxID=1974609 RepID=A0A2M6WEY9_9BACT|nr:MAG: hypothetical protein COU17_01020 [Candidatus Kaiserbacteria bacterium CG10_big_fil_rev_8_21_14_0_10_49_17]